jgi:hypothetical protein
MVDLVFDRKQRCLGAGFSLATGRPMRVACSKSRPRRHSGLQHGRWYEPPARRRREEVPETLPIGGRRGRSPNPGQMFAFNAHGL